MVMHTATYAYHKNQHAGPYWILPIYENSVLIKCWIFQDMYRRTTVMGYSDYIFTAYFDLFYKKLNGYSKYQYLHGCT